MDLENGKKNLDSTQSASDGGEKLVESTPPPGPKAKRAEEVAKTEQPRVSDASDDMAKAAKEGPVGKPTANAIDAQPTSPEAEARSEKAAKVAAAKAAAGAKAKAARPTQTEEQKKVSPASKARGARFKDEDTLQSEIWGSQESQTLPGVWQAAPGVVATTVQNLLNWGRQNSLWYFLFATACCGIELMAFGASKFDADRHGMVPWASPRQADLMIVAGTVNEKMGEKIVDLYNQMAEPRFVIAMGACASNGGPFWTGYNVVDGVDKLIPVDVYVPGCPPRPEALLDSVYKLRAKIARAGQVPSRV